MIFKLLKIIIRQLPDNFINYFLTAMFNVNEFYQVTALINLFHVTAAQVIYVSNFS